MDGYSKSKAQRDVAGHCTWLKRTLASFNQEILTHLDLEYSSGSAWLGDHMVASALRAPPVTVDEADVIWDDLGFGLVRLRNLRGLQQWDLRLL